MTLAGAGRPLGPGSSPAQLGEHSDQHRMLCALLGLLLVVPRNVPEGRSDDDQTPTTCPRNRREMGSHP